MYVLVLADIVATTILVSSQVSNNGYSSYETNCRYFDEIFVPACSGICHFLQLAVQLMAEESCVAGLKCCEPEYQIKVSDAQSCIGSS